MDMKLFVGEFKLTMA